MINAIDGNAVLGQATSLPTPSAQDGGFDAALAAAHKAEASQKAHDSEMEAIRDKGFSAWVRDMRIERLKEELRKKVMAAMGLDEDSLAQMEPMVQKILERKIQDEVEKQLAQVLQEEDEGRQRQAGKNDRRGISCPVIPALAGAEGVVVF